MAKTTLVETVYHRGCAVKVTTAMKDIMEAKDWIGGCERQGTAPIFFSSKSQFFFANYSFF